MGSRGVIELACGLRCPSLGGCEPLVAGAHNPEFGKRGERWLKLHTVRPLTVACGDSSHSRLRGAFVNVLGAKDCIIERDGLVQRHKTCSGGSDSRTTSRPITALHRASSETTKSIVARATGAADADSDAEVKLPPLPEKRVVVGCGSAGLDYLASVAEYPQPDDKIRTEDFVIQGGGNVANALTAAARLGLTPRILTKVADDSSGRVILEELQKDGVDTTHAVVAEGGVSPFTYIIVDKKTKTRTCIHTPGSPAMAAEELSNDAISSLLKDASIVYFDVRLWETAVKLAKEAKARGLPILVDAEKKRDGLDELLSLASYAVCSAKFPQSWTGSATLADALLQMLLRLPQLEFVITTLGAEGCVMIQRRRPPVSNPQVKEDDPSGALDLVDVGRALGRLKLEAQQERGRGDSQSALMPTVFSSQIGRLVLSGSSSSSSSSSSPSSVEGGEEEEEEEGSRSIIGTVMYGTAVNLLPQEVFDTTGAGDAFIGTVLYALCAGLPPSTMLPLAATVAAAKCRAMGARAGLPFREDRRLASLLKREPITTKNQESVRLERRKRELQREMQLRLKRELEAGALGKDGSPEKDDMWGNIMASKDPEWTEPIKNLGKWIIENTETPARQGSIFDFAGLAFGMIFVVWFFFLLIATNVIEVPFIHLE